MVHKLCRLKIGNFWPPFYLLVVFLLSKIDNVEEKWNQIIQFGKKSWTLLFSLYITLSLYRLNHNTIQWQCNNTVQSFSKKRENNWTETHKRQALLPSNLSTFVEELRRKSALNITFFYDSHYKAHLGLLWLLHYDWNL